MLDSAFPIYLLTFLFTLLFTVFLEKKLVPALRKKAAQPIYTDGPTWHIKKEGTPTMGGIAFLIAITLGILISVPIFLSLKSDLSILSLLITLGFALSNSLIGIFDDLKKLGVVMKRAQYFLTASGKMADDLHFSPDSLLQNLIALEKPLFPQQESVQLSLFDPVS